MDDTLIITTPNLAVSTSIQLAYFHGHQRHVRSHKGPKKPSKNNATGLCLQTRSPINSVKSPKPFVHHK